MHNVSLSTREEIARTKFPATLLHNLHIDMANAAAYTVAIRNNSTKIIQVLGGAVTTLLDITEYVPAGHHVPLGGSTACSDTDDMWVNV